MNKPKIVHKNKKYAFVDGLLFGLFMAWLFPHPLTPKKY